MMTATQVVQFRPVFFNHLQHGELSGQFCRELLAAARVMAERFAQPCAVAKISKVGAQKGKRRLSPSSRHGDDSRRSTNGVRVHIACPSVSRLAGAGAWCRHFRGLGLSDLMSGLWRMGLSST